MRNSVTIAILFLSVVTVTSCSNSKKDGAATINDLKAKIEKEAAEKPDAGAEAFSAATAAPAGETCCAD